MMQRAIDIVVGAIGLAAFILTFPIIAIAIKLDTPGPIFFIQKRVGYKGKPFTFYKYRSMSHEGHKPYETPKLEHEHFRTFVFITPTSRLTRVGRFLRATSLDELPNFWNVLRGDMSLVGPRPLPLDEAHLATDHFADRSVLRPGMTGPWQIHGRSDIPFDDMVRLDYSYVSTWSLQEDLRLMIRTVGVVLGGRGAY